MQELRDSDFAAYWGCLLDAGFNFTLPVDFIPYIILTRISNSTVSESTNAVVANAPGTYDQAMPSLTVEANIAELVCLPYIANKDQSGHDQCLEDIPKYKRRKDAPLTYAVSSSFPCLPQIGVFMQVRARYAMLN